MEKLYKYLKLAVVLAVVVLIIVIAPKLWGLTPQQLLSYAPHSLPLAALVLVGLYCVKPVLMVIPTYGLYIAAGMLFPTGWAIALAYMGLACELSLGWLGGRWLGRERVDALMQKNAKAAKFASFLENNGPSVCFITRALPMPYPIDLGSLFFGASGMRFVIHLLCSLLGLSAVMIPLTLAGGAIDNPLSARFLVPFAVSVVVCGGLFAALQLWQRRQKIAAAAKKDGE